MTKRLRRISLAKTTIADEFVVTRDDHPKRAIAFVLEDWIVIVTRTRAYRFLQHFRLPDRFAIRHRRIVQQALVKERQFTSRHDTPAARHPRLADDRIVEAENHRLGYFRGRRLG